MQVKTAAEGEIPSRRIYMFYFNAKLAFAAVRLTAREKKEAKA